MPLLIRDKIISALFEECNCNNHVSKLSLKIFKKSKMRQKNLTDLQHEAGESVRFFFYSDCDYRRIS